ncbi:hypothetical protein BJX63DRAFT_364460 [Aspergillus granulosus]|uniref:Uncharacterized protein n=1 Tax=Aspergillus granulosus TaxID=176169 RepID=A0ABR4H1P3_9EURO
MTESAFGFMPQVFFVDDHPYRKARIPRTVLRTTSRSHAARMAHEKRKAVKASIIQGDKREKPQDGGSQSVTLLRNAKITDIPTSIKIFLQVVVPGVRPICTLFNVRCVISEESLSFMAQDVFFHAGAAAIHAAYDQLVNPDFRTRPSLIIYKHRGKALAELRQHIARGDGITDAMLIAVCFLALLERRYDEIEAHNVHKQVLGTLVAARGGLDALSPQTRSVLMQYEFPWALESGFSVLQRTERRQPLYPPVYSTANLLERTKNLPEGFAALALTGDLSMQLLGTLEQILQATMMGLEQVSTNSQTRYMFDDFWDALPSLSCYDAEEPWLDNLLFLCLIVYAGLRYSAIPQVNNISVCMRSSLKGKLLRCRRQRAPIIEDCLCWISTVAVSAWRHLDGTLDTPGIELLKWQRIRFAYLRSEEEYEKVLRRFFWDDRYRTTCQEVLRYPVGMNHGPMII